MNNERFYQSEKFLLTGGAQTFIFFMVGILILLRGSLLGLPVYALGSLLAFNVLLWLKPMAKNRPWLGRHTYFALQTLFVFLLYRHDVIFGLLFSILCAESVIMLPARTCLIWLGLFTSVALWGNFCLHPEVGVVSAQVRAFIYISLFFFTSLIACVISQARRSREQVKRLLTELSDAHLLLQDYTEKAESRAVSKERARLSRELHDSIGHRLTTSIVQLEAVLGLIARQETQRLTKIIENVHGQLNEGLHELRYTIHELYDPRRAGNSLPRSLQRLADEFAAATDVTIHTQLPDAMPSLLSDIQHTTIYRTAQEALTNTQKHAQAQNIWLTLDVSINSLVLTVCNDGQDFVPAPNDNGHGLRGMRERAAQFGGTFFVTRPEDGGTLLTLILPLQARKAK